MAERPCSCASCAFGVDGDNLRCGVPETWLMGVMKRSLVVEREAAAEYMRTRRRITRVGKPCPKIN